MGLEVCKSTSKQCYGHHVYPQSQRFLDVLHELVEINVGLAFLVYFIIR